MNFAILLALSLIFTSTQTLAVHKTRSAKTSSIKSKISSSLAKVEEDRSPVPGKKNVYILPSYRAYPKKDLGTKVQAKIGNYEVVGGTIFVKTNPLSTNGRLVAIDRIGRKGTLTGIAILKLKDINDAEIIAIKYGMTIVKKNQSLKTVVVALESKPSAIEKLNLMNNDALIEFLDVDVDFSPNAKL